MYIIVPNNYFENMIHRISMRDNDDYRARKIAEFREKTRVCIQKVII